MIVAIRTDASKNIGMGHLMRCLTLARGLKKNGHTVFFLFRQSDIPITHFLNKAGFSGIEITSDSTIDEKQDAKASLAAIGTQGCDWIIVDHYQLGHIWHQDIQACCGRLLVIDDVAGRALKANLVLNQNYSLSHEKDYKGLIPKDCSLLTGPDYALVREEFSVLREVIFSKRENNELNRLLVTLGGGDSFRETSLALKAILSSNKVWAHIDVVIGGSCTNIPLLENTIATIPHALLHIQTDNMAKLMADADFAIAAGGSTTWEKCTLGLPSVTLILSEDQMAVTKSMAATGAHFSLGHIDHISHLDLAHFLDNLTPDSLVDMSKSAFAICDGQGVQRVISTLEEFRRTEQSEKFTRTAK